MDNLQYQMRAYLVPDTATNAMNRVLNNLDVARRLGRSYINPGMDLIHQFMESMISARREYETNEPVLSVSISDARAVLAINDAAVITVDVVEAAFEREANIILTNPKVHS
jgi:hypothetical protein